MNPVLLTTKMRLKAWNVQYHCFTMEHTNELNLEAVKTINKKADEIENLTQHMEQYISRLEAENALRVKEIIRLEEKVKDLQKKLASVENNNTSGTSNQL